MYTVWSTKAGTLTLLEVRVLVPFGGRDRQRLEGGKVMFWGIGNVLFPGMGASYVGMFNL